MPLSGLLGHYHFLPSNTVTREIKIRNQYHDYDAGELIPILKKFNLYCALRDLIITSKKGGYIIEKTSDNSYNFIDVPNWIGNEDRKARYFSQYVDNHISTYVQRHEGIESSPLERDFPKEIDCGKFNSNDFWNVYVYLWEISYEYKKTHYKKNAHGVTTNTEKLTIIRNISSLNREISKAKKIPYEVVSHVTDWLIFDKETNYKFSLFHCPLVKINNNLVLLSPISILTTHVPTTFLRLLAHKNKKALDSFSSQLEKEKIGELISHMQSNATTVKPGLKTKVNKKVVEIDIVEFNKENHSLSLVQAKFFIRPDTVIEVYGANETIEKAVKQLQRNKDLVENTNLLKQICDLMGISTQEIKTINYILLPTNFVGSDYVTIDKWINIIPMEFYLLPENKGKSISDVASSFKNIVATIPDMQACTEVSFDFAGMSITCPTLSM